MFTYSHMYQIPFWRYEPLYLYSGLLLKECFSISLSKILSLGPVRQRLLMQEQGLSSQTRLKWFHHGSNWSRQPLGWHLWYSAAQPWWDCFHCSWDPDDYLILWCCWALHRFLPFLLPPPPFSGSRYIDKNRQMERETEGQSKDCGADP